MEVTEEIRQLLAALEYDPKWMEYGFLSESELRYQWEIYQRGEDQNTEHYRYRSFCRISDSRTAFDIATFERYVTLALLDPDIAMARSALYNLIVRSNLTEEQIEYLAQKQEPMIDELLAKRSSVMAREELLNLVKTAETADEVFDLCLSSKDALVQRALTDRTDLSLAQWEILAEKGLTKAVRNIARVRHDRLKKQR